MLLARSIGMRVLPTLMTLLLVGSALAAFSPAASASPVCVDVPRDGGMLDACTSLDVEACSALGFCVDPGNPKGTATEFVAWAKEQLGPCTCDPGPDAGP